MGRERKHNKKQQNNLPENGKQQNNLLAKQQNNLPENSNTWLKMFAPEKKRNTETKEQKKPGSGPQNS